MFTRNWYKAMLAQMYNNAAITGTDCLGGTFKFVSGSAGGYTANNGVYTNTQLFLTGGSSTSSLSDNKYIANLAQVRTSLTPGGVYFGTGDKEPTFDDYAISGEIISTIAASANVVATPDDDGCTFVSTYTVTNNGSAPVTIKEVCLYYRAPSEGLFLVERTLLDTPVTIDADGGVGQVTYTIRFNYPTA